MQKVRLKFLSMDNDNDADRDAVDKAGGMTIVLRTFM